MTFGCDPDYARKLKRALVERLNYSESGADSLALSVPGLSAECRRALDEWMAGRPCADLSVREFSLERLTGKEYGMNIPNAIATLNWLIEDYDTAKAALSPMRTDSISARNAFRKPLREEES